MAKKPQITKIEADISKLSIYLRSTKKWGKTTLFRDTVLAKFGDPSYGLLVGCGAEVGYTMLDNLNAIQAETWTDLTDISKLEFTSSPEVDTLRIEDACANVIAADSSVTANVSLSITFLIVCLKFKC